MPPALVTRISAIIRQILAVAGIVIAAVPQDHLPNTVKIVFAAGAVLLLNLEHGMAALNDPSSAVRVAIAHTGAAVHVVPVTPDVSPESPAVIQARLDLATAQAKLLAVQANAA